MKNKNNPVTTEQNQNTFEMIVKNIQAKISETSYIDDLVMRYKALTIIEEEIKNCTSNAESKIMKQADGSGSV